MASTANDTNEPASGGLQVAPPARQRVADHVFETLARAIFNAELKPGGPLPTQRDLAQRFKISPLVVRQAIHRLEDLGLVRVRQGSTTIILDPAESTDIRLIQLQMELADPGKDLASDAFENQVLFMVPMLVLAERRVTQEELAVLDYIVDGVDRPEATDDDGRRFRIEYWRQIAKATHNSMFQQQVRWWSTMVEALEAQGKNYGAPRGPVMVKFYRTLNATLAKRQGTVDFYVTSMRPLLDWMDSQRAAKQQAGKAGAPAGAKPKQS